MGPAGAMWVAPAISSHAANLMVDHTHYYLIAGDGHIRGRRGPGPTLVDPVLGQILTVAYAPSPAPVINTVVKGATSGVWGRVIRILSTTSWVIEAWPATIVVNALPGVPVPVTQPGGAFVPNELVNFDNGSSSNVMPFESFQDMPQANQIVHEKRDAPFVTPIPDDRSDTPFWDRHAKYSRAVVLDGATVGVGEIFLQGYKCTTSGGAAFTILLGNVAGSDFQLQVVKVTGTLVVGHTVTNTTTGHVATIKSLGADPPVGAWVTHDILPNNAGTGALWEIPPNGNGTDGGDPSLGPEATLLRRAFSKHRGASSVADRGTRLIPFSTFDNSAVGSTDPFIGGVTLQLVKCSGTFPSTWTPNETVSCGGWSGKVHGFNAVSKYLFVYDVNGATLAGGTVTGATSGASATCSGPAIGWQPGSKYWNDMFAEIATAQGASGALFMGSAAQFAGALLMPWEAEIGMFGTSVGASWPTFERIQGQWIKWITAVRAQLGDPNLPIALFRGDTRSHSSDVQVFGVPYAALLVQVLDSIPKFLTKVRLVSTDGMQPAQTGPLPYTSNLLFWRTDDYPEMGERAWRCIEFSNVVIPAGNFEPLPIILIAGQSQAVSGISWQMLTLDRDPDLYSSALFTTATGNTIDTSVVHFRSDTMSWEPYDVYYGNTFFGQGPGNFGIEAPIALRFKKRFAEAPSTTAELGIIKVAVGGASCNANATGSPATFDPDASERTTTVANCAVTVIAGTSLVPARGRFTGPPGTFSSWVLNANSSVAGSALGFQTLGGNNSLPYRGGTCKAIGVDGTYVEIEGTFVAEATRSFTLTQGPYPLYREVENVIRVAFEKCATQLRRIPKPVAKLWWNGEGDLERYTEYQAALTRTLEWMETIFGQRHKGETPTATVVMELTPNTPWGVTDEAIATLIQAQRAVAASMPNTVSVSTAKLPMESSGVWPRTNRLHNGVHHTVRGFLMAGFMADEAFGGLTGIPAHPEGSAAVDFGTDGSGGVFVDGVGTDVVGAGDGGTDDLGGGTDTPGDLVVEDGTGRADAESYASVAYADTYWSRHGSPTFWTGATLEQKEVALRAATAEGIDGLYGGLFRGQIESQEQRLQFPRVGCYDDDGRAIASGTVPWRVQEATVLLAGDVRAGEKLLPSEVDRGMVVSETKKGAGFEKSVTYAQGGAAGSVKRRRAAEALLWPLFWSVEQGVTRS